MYAIIETGGKQYKVESGDVIYVEKLTAQENDTVDFKVVALATENDMKVGSPYVADAKVTGKVLKNGKGKKLPLPHISPRRAKRERWVTDSLIRRLKSRLLKRKP